MTLKPRNGLLHPNFVFMPIWVEIARNSSKTLKNGQIWSKTSKWPKKPQNGLLHSNYVFMPIWVEIAQNLTKTTQNGQI